MRLKDKYESVVICSGDGDFMILLDYLKNICNKKVQIIARGKRTSHIIKQFAGSYFVDFINLKEFIEYK